MPVAFFGHGSPRNTVSANRFTDAWRAYAASLPAPEPSSSAARPATIHDFNSHFERAFFAYE